MNVMGLGLTYHRAAGPMKLEKGGRIFGPTWQLDTLALLQLFSNYAVTKLFFLFEDEERNTSKGHTGLIKLIPINVPARYLRRH